MTTRPQHIQINLKVSPETVFAALTETTQLQEWFAEYADVSIPEKRYDFWGRFTPENPTREQGQHPVLEVQPNRYLKFAWPSFGEDSIVEMALRPTDGGTLLTLRHHGKHYEDFWFLALENLRRQVEGIGPAVRYDYTRPVTGDIHHSLDINAPASTVFAILTEADQLDRWISSTGKVNPTVGGEINYGWAGVPALEIVSIEPDKELSVKWFDPEGETIIKWTLEESDGKTHMTFVQSGFAPTKRTDDINPGWLNFMSWVKSAAEEGAAWSVPAKNIAPEMMTYYPGSMGKRQSEIVWITPRESATKLGDYAELQTPVPNLDDARAFYLELGFKAISDHLLTDGRLNVRLVEGAGKTKLVYNGPSAEYFTDPTGLPVEATTVEDINLEQSGSTTKQSLTAIGKFGEWALPCPDVKGTVAFWQQFGFRALLVSEDPNPWAIITDDSIIIGLHQGESAPHITYFAANMPETIAELGKRGLTVKSFDPPGTEPITNAEIVAPGGQGIYLFTGEI